MKPNNLKYVLLLNNRPSPALLCQDGSVLVMALVMSLFLAFLGAAALFTAFYEAQNSIRRSQRTVAEAIARAGIEQVIYWFNNSSKAPGSIAQQTGRTDWAYNYKFVRPGDDGYHDNDMNGYFSPGDTLKTADEDPMWYDFNGNGQYDTIPGLLFNPGNWVPDVEVPAADIPTFPNGRIERLIIYAPPPASNPKLRARATILCVATAGNPSGTIVDARVIMRCVVKEFRPFDVILAGVNVHGVASISAQCNMHWGDFYVLDGEPYLDYNMNGQFDSATEPYVDTNANGQFDSQGIGGDIDFGTLNIANKIDTYSRDPWANYYAERNILTNRAFTPGNYKSAEGVETFTIPKSYTPRPDGSAFYHIHRWCVDVFEDKNRNAKWDSGGWLPGVTWDRGLDGKNVTNDRGEGNGIFDAEPFVDANSNGVFDYTPHGESFTDVNGNGVYDGKGEGYRDLNGNGQYDPGEPFDDADLNGTYTGVREPFIDQNGNHTWDPGEPFTDVNGNGIWGYSAEPYTDTNMNGHRDSELEPYWDRGRLNPARWTGGAWVPPSATYITPSGAYDVIYRDSNNNPYFCVAEGYRDLNSNGQYDPGEPFDDADGNGVYTAIVIGPGWNSNVEPFTDLNGNGQYDPGEPFEDLNGNRRWGYVNEPYWDRDMDGYHDGTGEGFYDFNNNGIRDTEDYGAEPYNDINKNGKWDPGEPYSDLNGNGIFDLASVSEIYHDRTGPSGCEAFTDSNNDGYYQDFESFTDSNGDSIRNANQKFDGGERFVDVNLNLRYDMEPFTDTNNNGVYDVFSPKGEPFTDSNGNGKWDPDGAGEPFTDLNGNGQWDPDGAPSEPFTDLNGNGVWDPKEILTVDWNGNGIYDAKNKIKGKDMGPDVYIDSNGNGQWDDAEPYTDTNGNGIWDPVTPEPYTDLNGNGQYDPTGLPEPYTDLNGNGKYDAVLGEPFQDVGLDGIAGTNDYGENNGTYDCEPFMDDGITGIADASGNPTTNSAWAGNRKCDGDPWIDTNGNGILDGEPMFDKNRNYRADSRLPFPVADYDALKAYAKRIGTYYYGDSAGNIRNEQGVIVNFKNEWANKTGFYFVDSKDQTPPRFPTGSDPGNLVNLSISGSFFTKASLYIAGNLSFTGLGSGMGIRAKNPGELRNDANGNGSYDAPNGEWTSTDARGYTVHHAAGMEVYYDANGNGIYDLGEWFRDYNGNGVCDVEEYVDDMDVNGKPDDQLNFNETQNFRFGPYYSPGSNINVHLACVVYCAGKFDGGGNCIVYGAVVAQNGFEVGGTPDVYYNVDLSYSMATGINTNVLPVSWEVLNR